MLGLLLEVSAATLAVAHSRRSQSTSASNSGTNASPAGPLVARAAAWWEQRQQRRIANATAMWALGFWDQKRAAQYCDPTLEHVGRRIETPRPCLIMGWTGWGLVATSRGCFTLAESIDPS
jgi:hypothetical protein